MANDEASDAEKKSPFMVMVVSIAVLTLLGAAGGWLTGTFIAPKIASIQSASETAANIADASQTKDGIEKIPAEANGIVQLEPITTNLAYPSTNWVRLELALMFNGPIDVLMAEDIHQDILAYVRTVSLQQLEGARGFQYLRDDVQERVDQRSKGQVSKVMFRTFVIE